MTTTLEILFGEIVGFKYRKLMLTNTQTEYTKFFVFT